MKHLFVILLLAASYQVSAQFVPSTSTIRTPYGNVSSTTWRYQPMYYGTRSGSGLVVPVDQKYEYVIVLKSDSVVRAKTRLEPGDTFSIEVAKGKSKRIIKPADTKEIYRISRKGNKLTGIPADSCWWFTCTKGKINGYSKYSATGAQYSEMFSVGDGEMMRLTDSNLEAALPTDADKRVRRFLKRGLLVKAINAYNGNLP